MSASSRSMNTARGMCFLAPVSLKKVLKESSPPPMVLSEGCIATMLQAVELPTGTANLHSSLSNVHEDTHTKRKIRASCKTLQKCHNFKKAIARMNRLASHLASCSHICHAPDSTAPNRHYNLACSMLMEIYIASH